MIDREGRGVVGTSSSDRINTCGRRRVDIRALTAGSSTKNIPSGSLVRLGSLVLRSRTIGSISSSGSSMKTRVRERRPERDEGRVVINRVVED